MPYDAERDAFIADAAEPYRQWGLCAWGFAKGKLRGDPVYLDLLSAEILPHQGTLVDLGCGQGLMLACLSAARKRYRSGQWPPAWAAPPTDLALYGIEHRARIAQTAQHVLGTAATVVHGDIRDAVLPRATAALLLDVLHLLPFADQEKIVSRSAAALEPGGVLLIREADKSAGWGFTAVRVGNWLTAVSQLDPARRFYFRSAGQWRTLVESCGLTVQVRLMSEGTPFANVLIEARKG